MDLPNEFQNHLQTARGVSPRTLRNYRSDLKHFFGWISLKLTAQGVAADNWQTALPHLTPQLIAEYKGYHLENKIPYSTINRRFSTLRNFARFLHQNQLIGQDPMLLISNVRRQPTWKPREKLIRDFEQHLTREGVSPLTLKNYLSDIRQFLAWIPGQEV